MGYVGVKPSAVPLTSADITDNIIVNADINSSAAIALTKLASTGTLTVDNIQFPATAVASANANNLDDYEEGTWTPAFTNLTINSGTPVFGGNYTKIGRLVLINWSISGTHNITITADSTHINNLPFSVGSHTGVFIPVGSINAFYGMVTGNNTAYSASTISNTTQAFAGTLACVT
jgi:hypothetical protein